MILGILPLGLQILMGAGAGISILGGLASLFGSKKVPEYMKRYEAMMKERMEHGLLPTEKAGFMEAGVSDITRQVGAMQNRGAAALASRGVEGGSAANEMIAGVNQTQGDMFSKLQKSLADLDLQIKTQGTAGYSDVVNKMTGFDALNRQETIAGGQAIGSGLAQLASPEMIMSGLYGKKAAAAAEQMWGSEALFEKFMEQLDKLGYIKLPV